MQKGGPTASPWAKLYAASLALTRATVAAVHTAAPAGVGKSSAVSFAARARKDSEPSGSSRVTIGARSAARARAVVLLALRPLAPSSAVGVNPQSRRASDRAPWQRRGLRRCAWRLLRALAAPPVPSFRLSDCRRRQNETSAFCRPSRKCASRLNRNSGSPVHQIPLLRGRLQRRSVPYLNRRISRLLHAF